MVFRQLTVDAVNRALMTLDGVAGKSVNVAKVLQVLGAQPVATGFLGGERGREIQKQLEALGLDLEFVNVAASTRQCVTVIDQAAGTITELVEESRPVDPGAYQELLQVVQRRVKGCRAVVMSGTIASGGPADLYARCTQWAHEAGALTVVDASGEALRQALAAHPGVVKPNRAELEATVGFELTDDEALCRGIRELHERGAERVVITAGAKSAFAFDGSRFLRISTPQVQVQNPIGSGDAFTAGLVWQLTRGADLAEACRWASATGAANALTLMAGEVHREDVERLVQQVRIEEI
jgi:tagatose 6-phosphate kinase